MEPPGNIHYVRELLRKRIKAFLCITSGNTSQTETTDTCKVLQTNLQHFKFILLFDAVFKMVMSYSSCFKDTSSRQARNPFNKRAMTEIKLSKIKAPTFNLCVCVCVKFISFIIICIGDNLGVETSSCGVFLFYFLECFNNY